MLYPLVFASFVLVAMSHPSGPPPTGPPPTGRPHHGPGPCGHHPPGPPKCPSNDHSADQENNGKHGGTHGHHSHGPPHGGPMGPVGVIYCNLTQAQQQQVNQIMESSFNKTKNDLKSSLDAFVSGLSSELQAAVTVEKQQFEEMKANITARVKTLSQAAQDLSAKIFAVLEDDSLTFREDHQKIHEITEKADKAVVKELLDNHIPIPGLCRPPHGPPHHGDKKHQKKH